MIRKGRGIGQRLMWDKKEFTLMIIPGANRRTVRFKLPHSSLYIVPSVILLVLFGFFVTIYLMNTYAHRTKDHMQQAFDGQERQLVNQITLKNNELELLQANLIDLSHQADEFKVKLEEIKKLDHVLQLMSESEEPNRTSKKLSALSESAGGGPDVGGTDIPVTSEEVSQLMSSTRQGLSTLVGDINTLLVNLSESEARLKQADYLRSITPTLWPVTAHSQTSGFGMRRDPFTGKPSMHTGLDLDGEIGDPVYATAAGKVTEAGFDNEFGNRIILDHTRGIQTGYMHLHKILVKRGESVTKGQQIGLLGSTGRSTGSHLHYEVQKNRVPIDPTPYLITNRKDER
ncbi:M23 family metallopeptidase [Paenibacillus sp. GCM10023248]|uniref:M23 family metallopeptidase n=1 Tax=Bacillales TaxID=1385 RepID=UPI0023781F19|nr:MULTISPECIES: M23 family metallopeptidase [Bacillales]MDD9266688.1 M23 family metallopeptidase [Paenibacillus sp. MAHUQ-63]MDR6883633.1 murein DD-endopeptidase MepM/ murein hydrolase activator NlpD [Bacillus sp. 3255]